MQVSGKLKDNIKQISRELNNNIVLHVISFPNQVEVTLLETSLGCLTVQLTDAETYPKILGEVQQDKNKILNLNDKVVLQ